jgi:hypothetical protein
MKLRIHGDSLRLRLNRSDVEQFRNSGVCAESFRFTSDSRLTYTLETSSLLTVMEVQFFQDCIRVRLPLDMAEEWAGSGRISLSLSRPGDSAPVINSHCFFDERVQHCDAKRSSVGWHQYRCAFVLYEDHDEFRRLGFACVSTDDVDIIRAFVEGLTRC